MGVENSTIESPVAETNRASTPIRGWRGSKWLALVEFAIVGAIFWADQKGFIPISKTPFLLVLGWISLRLRGLRWRDVGLRRPRNWPLTLAIGVGAGLLMEGFELFVSQPLLMRITGRKPDFSDFQAIHGNPKFLLLFITLAWTLAAFGEEMVWRGYLMNRVADLGNRTRAAWTVSLIVVNLVFGYAHSYQGITGILDEGLLAIPMGLLYLGAGCNLFAPIIAHGVADTVDMLLMFLGRMPGM